MRTDAIRALVAQLAAADKRARQAEIRVAGLADHARKWRTLCATASAACACDDPDCEQRRLSRLR